MYLPDKRLDNVLDQFSERIKNRQTLSMRKLASSRTQEIQFGRFLANDRVRLEDLEKTLYHQCATSIPQHAHLLLVEDTSQMAFSRKRQITGLGKIDKGIVQGFYLHPVLTLDAHTGACYGVAKAEFGRRPLPDDGLTYRQRQTAAARIAFEDKEGYRWLRSIEGALPHLPTTTTKTVIADREGDIYAVLAGLQRHPGLHYLIRSRVDRLLATGQRLSSSLADWPVQQSYELDVPATDKRSAHRASLVVRVGQVSLKKTQAKTRQVLPLISPVGWSGCRKRPERWWARRLPLSGFC